MACVVPAAADENTAEQAAAPDQGRRPTILVTEDEILIRFFVAEELRAQGNLVLEAANAEEALALLRSGLEIDLLLTDVRMPGTLDGAALARRVRQDHPRVKIVVVSAHLRVGELAAEVDGFFIKPVDIPRLARHIQTLLPPPAARVVPFERP